MPSYSSRIGVAKVLLELEENDVSFCSHGDIVQQWHDVTFSFSNDVMYV